MRTRRFVLHAQWELRQCEECPHRGRGDESRRMSVCLECKETQPADCDDHCPTCQQNGTMFTACPKCGARWRHESSGWEVKHCGHPTANWPYHAADPEHPGRVVVTHNGKGFRKLVEAMQAVEGVLTGALVATNERCGPATRRVLTRDELRAEARP